MPGFSLGAGARGIKKLNAAVAFDPATLPLTLYLTDFAGLPWVGTASAGTSGSHNLVTNGVDPTVGASFGTHPSADFNGAQYIKTDVVMSAILSASAYSLQFIAEFDTAGATNAAIYSEPGIFANTSSYVNVSYTTSGVRAGRNTGADELTAYIALATSTKACIQMKYDGTNIKCRVNGGAWQSVAAANVTDLTVIGVCGVNYALTIFVDGRIAQVLASDTALSDATMDQLYAHAQANFAVP